LAADLSAVSRNNKEKGVFLPTSQWSLEARAGAVLRRRQRYPNAPRARWWSTEQVWRALVVAVTPEHEPILGRPLSHAERRRLVAQAARFDVALAPWRRERDRIAALLVAPVAGERWARPAGAAASAVFGPKIEVGKVAPATEA
jgi:hypothetical protein